MKGKAVSNRMNLVTFARNNRLNYRKDSCGDYVIPRRASKHEKTKRPEDLTHIYDQEDGKLLGVCFLLTSKQSWNKVILGLTQAGCQPKQNGDTEGTFLFDPANAAQVKAVLQYSRIKPRRLVSEEQKQAFRERMKAS